MRGKKLMVALLCATTMLAVTSMANAQSGVKFLGVGSSAMFNTFGVAAFTDACSSRIGSDCRHYSASGKNAGDGQNYAQILDVRSGSIPVEGGTLWVVWDNNTSPVSIWGYLSVDSIVGNRAFFAAPRAQLQLDAGIGSHGGENKVPASIMVNKQTNLTQADEAGLPANIISAIQTTFTAAMTDIRPEDAKYGTNRALAVLNTTNANGLGYGTPSLNCPGATLTIGCPILSSWSSSKATPVQFALSGSKDPITATKVPKSATISIGAEPIVFLYNNANASGLGAVDGGGIPILQDASRTALAAVFDGTQGGAAFLNAGLNNVPMSILLREPLSGTMNTTEFNTFRTLLAPLYKPAKDSQEKGINLGAGACPGPTCPNPLSLLTTNGGGQRLRGIGTGQIISGNGAGVGGLLNLTDSIGYAFFSYGNVKPLAGPTGKGRYITLDGVDPINSTWTDGTLPLCAAPCPAVPGTTFPHLRDGSYRTWTILRLATDDVGSANYANAFALVQAAQNEVNATVPDFVPFVCTGGVGTGCNDGVNVDAGMPYYKSHFKITGVTKATPPLSNGNPGQTKEYGGDVGGCPFQIATQPSQLCFRLNGSNTPTPVLPCNTPTVATACDLSPGH